MLVVSMSLVPGLMITYAAHVRPSVECIAVLGRCGGARLRPGAQSQLARGGQHTLAEPHQPQVGPGHILNIIVITHTICLIGVFRNRYT